MPKPTRVRDPRKEFLAWKAKVDLAIAEYASGLTGDCLPDFDYRANFEAKVSPKECARKAIRAARLY